MAFDRTAQPEPVELFLPGLRCAGCMRSVERALAEVPGLLNSRVNLTTKRVRAEIDAGVLDRGVLVAHLETAGFEARPVEQCLAETDALRAELRDLLLRIGVAGFAAMNVMLLSVSVWSGADAATRDLLHWVSALIALPAIAYAGRPFFAAAARALSRGRLSMEVPISLAVVLAAVGSVIETARSGEHAYFDAGVVLLFFLLIGRWLETKTRAGARSSAAELARLAPTEATRVAPDGTRERVAVSELRPGMDVFLAPGDRLPADGVIAEGRSDMDRALLTGESTPEPAAPGDAVHAGVLNLTGPLTVRLTATGEDTCLAEIARMVEAAERGRARWDGWADRAARIYAPAVHLLAFVAFVGWWWAGAGWAGSLQIACAVLVITCPCALALAVPTVHAVASDRLLRAGILLKDGAELERLAAVDMVAFDKTGTLTDGTPRLVSGPPAEDPAWGVARVLAEASRHPQARAIAEAAAHAEPAPVSDVQERAGFGVEGRLGGATVRLGRGGWAGEGPGTCLRMPDGRCVTFEVEDRLRADAAETCAALRGEGLKLAILSGDREAAVARAARTCEIEELHAALAPGGKVALLERWRADGRHVFMVGDGLNDGPALTAAHASMSPAEAADASRVAAGLVWTGRGLAPVALALRMARAARRRALESFAFAALYNLVAIPLAMAGFVTPLIAALAMSGSSLVVILNALRLRWMS